jgi:signal transduction histidine kinase
MSKVAVPRRRLRARAARATPSPRPAPPPDALVHTLARDVSHDLRAPLRTIRSYATFLREDYGERLDGEGRTMLDGLAAASQRLESRIAALTHLASLHGDPLADEHLDLHALLHEARAAVGLRPERVSVARPLPTVRGDRGRLREALSHLLRNAATYTQRPSPRVEVGAAGGRLFVRDDGIGIAPAHHEAVFRLFRRLHGRDEYGGGPGVGLTFARLIVERHGGRLWIESAPGAGCTVWFTLPGSL